MTQFSFAYKKRDVFSNVKIFASLFGSILYVHELEKQNVIFMREM